VGVNIAVVGAGYWGPNLIRTFNSLDTARVVTICDTNKQRLKHIKEQYGDVSTTLDYNEVLKDTNIDAVVVATPADNHYKLTKECLLADKDVFVEKPLALSVIKAEELVKLARKKSKIIFIGHIFLYNAAVVKIKEYIKQDELGDIYYIYSQRLNLGRVRQDINAMWNLAPHDISILLYWFDEMPIKTSAKGITYLQDGLEDVVFMNLDFANGKCAHIHTSWLDPNKVRKMTIVGSKKMIVYDDVSNDAKIQIYDKGITKKTISDDLGSYDNFGKFQLIHRAGDLLIPKIDFIEPLSAECKHFIECINTKRRPLTDGENGLEVVRILEAAQKSLKSGGLPVDI